MSTAPQTVPTSGLRPGRGAPELLSDYAMLFKARVTSMVVMTAWTGFYLACRKSGVSSVSWDLAQALLGIGMVSGGAAALNQVLEVEVDGRMLRPKGRPLPSERMGVAHAAMVAVLFAVLGSAYWEYVTNPLTGVLAFATAVSSCFAYTPLKKIAPISTFVGAFPGAMPPLLGWTAVRGKVEWEAVALFAIVFFWQFPHFLAIAWLYREDYERAGIVMRPVVDPTGRATSIEILLYGLGLIPVSMVPAFLHMAGWTYLVTAGVLGMIYLWFGTRLGRLNLAPSAPQSKKYARHLLRASVIYLPLLFAVLMITGKKH